MESICVCGLGKVGQPILELLRARGFRATGYDRDSAKCDAGIDEVVAESTAAIFIVQTPSLADGSFSNEHLLSALCKFRSAAPKDFLYIVTSTTTPGSCDGFRKIVGDSLVYKPEFIRLEHIEVDLRAPSFILIGEGTPEAGDRAERIYHAINPGVPVRRMSLMEAELAKITLNCALTMKISLANQLHLVAEKLGADSHRIMEAVGSDPRIGGEYLIPGWPYGGPCLPRDNRMFQFVAQSVGVDAALSKGADEINRMIHATD